MSMLTVVKELTGLRLMTPNDTYRLLQRIKVSFRGIIDKKKETDRIISGGEDQIDLSAPLMCSNGKRLRTYTKVEIEKDLFGGAAVRTLADQMDKHGIGGVYKDGKSTIWRVSQVERSEIAQKICNTFHPKVRHECEKIQIFLVNNLKGGGGKSTFTVNMGAALALTPTATNECIRVAIIDLDPQGSSTDTLLPHLDELNPDALSVGDLLMHNFSPLTFEGDETYSSVCKDSFLETNIPNLSILPARTRDASFDYHSKNASIEAVKRGQQYNTAELLAPIIESVKDDFDIILIDTPPQLSESSFGAHFIATSSIIPLKAAQNDRDSTAKYADQLPDLYQNMYKNGHQGYDSVSLVLMSHMETSRSEAQFDADLRSLLHEVMLTPFKHSEAIKACSDTFKTIYDISGSEYSRVDKASGSKNFGTKEQLVKAQDNGLMIARELMSKIDKTWANQRAAAGVKSGYELDMEEL